MDSKNENCVLVAILQCIFVLKIREFNAENQTIYVVLKKILTVSTEKNY
jgi:hypothetical protein